MHVFVKKNKNDNKQGSVISMLKINFTILSYVITFFIKKNQYH